jgi:TorA maturation chaperone TorD
MDNTLRANIYSMLSKLYSETLDSSSLEILRSFEFGESSQKWLSSYDDNTILDECNIDYTTIFLSNMKPIETIIYDSNADISVGLANPVMDFYFRHNYLLNLSQTHIQTPDHISIEFEFMAFLIKNGDIQSQREFLQKHLLNWSIAYLVSCIDIAKSPFYRDLFDFTIEFLISDFEEIKEIY